jgi:large subunit ribosomal protein L15
MTLTELSSKTGRKKRKRVGRGNASGMGTYCCRGMKGQTARSGGRRRPGFEGGQTPFVRRMPKLKGFKNPNYVDYQIINIASLNVFDDNAKVDIDALYKKNIVSKLTQPVKLLGVGELEKTLEITVDKASASAIKKVEAKKGTITVVASKKEEAPAKEEK